MKKIFLTLFLGVVLILNARSQCSFDNTFFEDLTPAGPGMTATEPFGYGGDLYTVSVIAGETYIFSTCAVDGFDTQLTLYDNTGTTVIDYVDDYCGLQSQITWTATYTGVVNLLLDEYDCSNTGVDQQVDVTWLGPPPVNDDCAGAIFLNCGDVATGNTNNATSDFGAPDCSFGIGFGPGVWYTFTGTGQPWTISLCGSSYDSYLSVYSGPDCSTLTCVGSNDDNSAACGFNGNSQIDNLATVAGTTYYILINGYGGDVGNYSLTAFSTAPANDDCSAAIGITPGTITGNTGCSTVDAVPLCGTASAPTTGGVWYSYTTGCSGNITASLCSGTTFNSQISVFSGTCAALSCVGGNDDFCATQSEVTWAGSAGTTYFILVHGSGTEEGPFSLNLTQVDGTAPVPDLAVLPPVSGSCSVIPSTPTATDNCVGTINGTTLDPTTYTVAGSYVVHWTYDDGNGNSSTQTQNVTVNPDPIAPTIVCVNDTTVSSESDVCGATVNYSMPTASDNCSTPYNGTDKYYIRSNSVGEPWGSNNNITAMDAVFGSGLWITEFFETCVPATVFSSSTKFVFLEGSDGNANELNAFLTANLPAIESYVYNGGTIFINAAPNEGGNIDFGFGGTTLNYNGGSSLCDGPVDAVNPSDPIVSGPFLPCTNVGYTGNSFSHAHITGSGLTTRLQGCGLFQFSSKSWGAGVAGFGGMTMPQFHSPSPDAQDLRQNIISSIANTNTSLNPPTITQTAGLPSGSLFPVGTTTNTFVATDGSGNSSSCSFDVIVNDDVPPATSGGALVISIYYGGFNLDESSWQLFDSTNTLIASGGPYFGFGSPGTLADQIDISGALEPLTFTGETQGFFNDNILDFEVTCGGTIISSGTINGGVVSQSFSGIQGCAVTLPTMSDDCSVTLGTPPPTLDDNCDGSVNGTTSDPLTYNVNGTYVVTWTFTDVTGNSSVLTQTVIINDSLAPVPDVANLPIVSNPCSVTVGTTPTATDNCVGAVNGTTTDVLTYNVAGIYTITWTYDDGRGNTSTQTQTVIVTDNAAPVPDQSILPNVTGNCVVSIPSLPTATDNCAGVISATTTDPTTYNLIGTFLVIWHFDDGNGNTWTQNQIVVVNPCLGVEDESGQWSALLYPNPSNGIFTLSLSEMPNENTQIRLVDALGQVLYSGISTGQIQQFDFSHLASANYYLLVTSDHGQISKPIIIRHNY
jgi:hypothetical protein